MTGRADLQSALALFLPGYRAHHRLHPRQRQVCEHVRTCRTAALGGMRLRCGHCGAEAPWYYACRDRHCPRCQRRASEAWCERQRRDVLPVTYYHVVFTLPHALNPWVQCHPEVIYRLLFGSVWSTLQAFAANPRGLDGQPGMSAVLHTWGQSLTQHVHLHCLIPGGALSRSGQWHAVRGNYLFPKRALSRRFRGAMVSALRRAHDQGELPGLAGGREVDAMLERLMATDWVVHPRSCLGHTETVVGYLARYTHRTAISDGRILQVDGEGVSLSYRDYRDRGRQKVMHLAGEEFLRRYLLHVLPRGLMRIRHFGFLANRVRKARLAQIRAILSEGCHEGEKARGNGGSETSPWSVLQDLRCEICGQGPMHVMGLLAPRRLDGG